MSLLEKMFNNDSFKKSIFSRLAKQAKEQGIKKLIITIEDNGEFKTDILNDDIILINKKTHDFLLNFYNSKKSGSDIIKPLTLEQIKNFKL